MASKESKTFTFNIVSRWDIANVLYAAELDIGLKTESLGLRLGAAVKLAFKAGAEIVALAARVTRINDPYEFFGWLTDKGLLIKAGCRFMTPDEYRAHVADSYTDKPKAEETLAIIDFIESRAKAVAATLPNQAAA